MKRLQKRRCHITLVVGMLERVFHVCERGRKRKRCMGDFVLGYYSFGLLESGGV